MTLAGARSGQRPLARRGRHMKDAEHPVAGRPAASASARQPLSEKRFSLRVKAVPLHRFVRHLAMSGIFVSALLASPPLQAQATADAVYLHGKVVTLDKGATIATAIAIRDGRFVAVGTDAQVRSHIGRRTEVVDLGGRTVIPGLNDTHAHIENAGLEGFVVPLGGARTVADALAAVKAFAATRKPGEWIGGSGWHPLVQLAERRYLTRAELDAAAPNNPVVLPTVGHVLMANSAALRQAGIGRGTPDPAGGKIERDEKGEPTGVLQEHAMDPVLVLVPPYTIEQLEAQFTRALRYANTFGLTSVLDPALSPDQIRALQRLMLAGKLTARMGVMWYPDPTQSFEAWEAKMQGNGVSSWFGSQWLKLVGIKMIVDGGMTLRTALTNAPYPGDGDYHGIATTTPDRLTKLVTIANKYDWRVGIHCVGDQACDWVLDAFEAVNRQQSIVDRRFAIIHGSLIHPDQLRRAKALGARLELQNVFMWDKAATVARFLGPDVAERAVPDRSAINILGIDNVSLGTDYPINPLNPFINLYIAVTRKDPTGRAYGAGQAVTREEALRMYTTSAAFATHEEDLKGSIEVGKLADFAVLSQDYLTVDPEAIKDIVVLRTVVDGKAVFIRDNSASGAKK